MSDNSLPALRVKHALTDEELRFLLAYARDPGADLVQVEQECGLPRGTARELLRSKKGRATISALLRTQDERYQDLQDQLIAMVVRLGFWDIKDCFDGKRQLLHPSELPDEIRVAITDFKYYPATGAVEYKFESRLNAIALLQKWFLERQGEKAGEDDEGRATWIARGRQELGPGKDK